MDEATTTMTTGMKENIRVTIETKSDPGAVNIAAICRPDSPSGMNYRQDWNANFECVARSRLG